MIKPLGKSIVFPAAVKQNGGELQLPSARVCPSSFELHLLIQILIEQKWQVANSKRAPSDKVCLTCGGILIFSHEEMRKEKRWQTLLAHVVMFNIQSSFDKCRLHMFSFEPSFVVFKKCQKYLFCVLVTEGSLYHESLISDTYWKPFFAQWQVCKTAFLNLLLGNNRMQLKASDDFNILLCIHHGEQEDQFTDKSLKKTDQ